MSNKKKNTKATKTTKKYKFGIKQIVALILAILMVGSVLTYIAYTI